MESEGYARGTRAERRNDMTYGEMRDFVLQLLNQYSVAGSQVPLSYYIDG